MSRLRSGPDPREVERERLLARERSEHFLALSPEMQEEFRARWQADLRRFDDRYGTRKRQLRHAALEGAVVLSLAKLLFGWSILAALLAVPLGALTGAAWFVTRAGRFKCMLLIIPAYLLLLVVVPPPAFVMTFFEAVFVLTMSCATGTSREFRRGEVSVM